MWLIQHIAILCTLCTVAKCIYWLVVPCPPTRAGPTMIDWFYKIIFFKISVEYLEKCFKISCKYCKIHLGNHLSSPFYFLHPANFPKLDRLIPVLFALFDALMNIVYMYLYAPILILLGPLVSKCSVLKFRATSAMTKDETEDKVRRQCASFTN